MMTGKSCCRGAGFIGESHKTKALPGQRSGFNLDRAKGHFALKLFFETENL
jgi:hypothetical protein